MWFWWVKSAEKLFWVINWEFLQRNSSPPESLLLFFFFIFFYLVNETSLTEMIKNSCELVELVRFRPPSHDFEVKLKFSAYCWRRRCFGKQQDDQFLLKFRKHCSSWRWLTINANFYILIKISSLWTKWCIYNTILTI